MKKLKKSIKILLISCISILCVTAIAVGCILGFRDKNPNNPNNPTGPVNPPPVVLSGYNLLKGQVNNNNAQELESKFSILTSLPYDGVCEEEDLILVGSNYFIYKDDSNNDRFVSYRNNGSSFSIKDLTDDVNGFVEKDAVSYEIESHNNEYLILESKFQSTDECINSIFNVIYFDCENPVKVYSYDTRNYKTYNIGVSLKERYCIFDNSNDVVEKGDYQTGKFNYEVVKLNKRNTIDSSNIKKIEFTVSSEGLTAFEVSSDENYYSILINNTIHVIFVNDNGIYYKKVELGEQKSAKVYNFSTEKLLLEVISYSDSSSKVDTSVLVEEGENNTYKDYTYSILSIKNNEIIVENYTLENDYSFVNNVSYFGNGLTCVSQQKVENNLLQDLYLNIYYDNNDVIVKYETTKENDFIKNVYDDKFVTEKGVYKNNNNSKLYELVTDFEESKLDYLFSDNNGFILTNTEKYTIGLMNLDCEFDQDFENLKISNIYSLTKNIYLLNCYGNYYKYNSATKEKLLLEKIYIDDNFNTLINELKVYVIEKEENKFELYNYEKLICEFTEFKFVSDLYYGSIVQFYNNDKLVLNLNTDDGLCYKTSNDIDEELVENYSYVTTEYLYADNCVVEITKYDSYASSSGFSQKGNIFGNAYCKFTVNMSVGYVLNNIKMNYYNDFTHNVTDGLSDGATYRSKSVDTSKTSSNKESVSIDWSGASGSKSFTGYYVASGSYYARRYYFSLTSGTWAGSAEIKSLNSQAFYYLITLNDNGGSGGTGSRAYHYGHTPSSVAVPKKTGYSFKGYYSGSTQVVNSSGGFTSNISIIKYDITLTASWTANKYTITFDKQGGTGGSNSITFTYGSTPPSFTPPTKNGWNFVKYKAPSSAIYGCNANETYGYSDGSWANDTCTDIYGNITMYAEWERKTIKVTFNTNKSGAGDITNSGTTAVWFKYGLGTFYTNSACTSSYAISKIVCPTRNGWTFDRYRAPSTATYGCNANETYFYNDGSWASDTDDDIYDNITLYAEWIPNIYKVTFNRNASSGITTNGTTNLWYKFNTNTMYSDAGCSTSVSSYTVPVRNGYNFNGYTKNGTTYFNSNGTWANTVVTTFYSDTTFDASWSPKINKITLNPNATSSTGLTGNGTTTVWFKYDSSTLYTNAACTTQLANNTITKPTRTGYTFTNYKTNSAQYGCTNGEIYFNSNGVAINSPHTDIYGDITLYATWTANKYTITLVANGGTIDSPYSVYSGSAGLTIDNSTNVITATYDSVGIFKITAVRTGYKFSGWTNSGSGTVTPKALNGTTEYAFDTYYTTINSQTTSKISVKTSVKNLTSTNNGSVTLTAIWTPINYYIEYNANTPSNASSSVAGTVNNTTMTYDSTTVKFAKNSYSLVGWSQASPCWSTNKNATTGTYASEASHNAANLTTVNNGTVVLYAIWKANIYTVTIDADGGTFTQGTLSNLTKVDNLNIKATYDTKGSFYGSIVKAGYMFDGWTVSTGKGTVSSKPQNSSYGSFISYYDANTNTNTKIDTYTEILNLTPNVNGTVTLKAKWSSIKYKVQLSSGNNIAKITYPTDTLVSDNISYANGIYTVSYDSTQSFKINAVYKGYMFDGWTISTGAGTATPKPTNTSYSTFNAYYTAVPDTTSAISVTTSVLNLTKVSGATVTLTVVWKPITYSIQLVPNGANGAISSHTNVSGTTFVSPDKFTLTYDTVGKFTVSAVRKGYKFNSWRIETEIGTATSKPNTSYTTFANYYAANTQTTTPVSVYSEVNNVSVKLNQVVKLYIEWDAIVYTIKYMPNDPAGSTYNPTGNTSGSTSVYDKNNKLSTNGFSLIGWTYLGWSSNSAATSATYASAASTTDNLTTIDGAEVNLYAIWTKNTYKINYILNGGFETSSKSYPKTVKFDEVFRVSIPERIGYTFDKYYISVFTTNNTKSQGTNSSNLSVLANNVTNYTSTYKVDSFYKNLSSKANDTINFEAYWTPNKYQLEYKYNEGKANPAGGYPSTATYDVQFSVTDPVRLGYTFTGWNITGMDSICTHYLGSKTSTATYENNVDDPNSVSMTFKNLRATNAVVTFTATWRNNIYNISYDYTNGWESTASGYVYPKTMTFDTWSKLSNPVRIGYTFTGWSVSGMSDTCPHYYGVNENINDATKTTLTTASIENVAVIKFLNLHSEDKATVYFKANWNANTYNISYVMEYNGQVGGLGSGTFPTSAVYDKSFKVDAPTQFPFGYYFAGWVLTAMSTDCKHYYSNLSNTITSKYTEAAEFTVEAIDKYFMNLHSIQGATVVLKPNWQPNVYKLSYILTDTKGGDGRFSTSNPAPTTAMYDRQFTVPNPIRTGYTFMGWTLSGLADGATIDNVYKQLEHYHSANNTMFYSTNGGYFDDVNPNKYVVVNTGIFKNLHYENDATVYLTASWKANTYHITYHYLNENFDTSIFVGTQAEVVPGKEVINIYKSAGTKTKMQTVIYDSYFTTMKMSRSDADSTGVVVPTDVKILFWIFYSGTIADGTVLAVMDANKNPQPKTKYVLNVGMEYVFSSYVQFEEYPLFGSDVHAYAIYGFSQIEIKVFDADSKAGYNNLSCYSHTSTLGAVSLSNFTFPTKDHNGQDILGFWISSNYYTEGEITKGSITKFTVAGIEYVANKGAIVKWGYPTSEAQDPENPVFYLYAVYDCSMQNYHKPTVATTNVIKLNTINTFENGKSYTITIRSLENENYFDFEYIKLASGYDKTGSNVAFDKVYNHDGIKSDTVSSNVTNFSVNVINKTTMTITFTANASCINYQLYLFYDSSKSVDVSYVENVEVLIKENKS